MLEEFWQQFDSLGPSSLWLTTKSHEGLTILHVMKALVMVKFKLKSK